jgi:hypothetical protein
MTLEEQKTKVIESLTRTVETLTISNAELWRDSREEHQQYMQTVEQCILRNNKIQKLQEELKRERDSRIGLGEAIREDTRETIKKHFLSNLEVLTNIGAEVGQGITSWEEGMKKMGAVILQVFQEEREEDYDCCEDEVEEDS